ncbi:Late promoter-activating protein, partial [Escherichia coli]|nr:Late promoter-activating protein [Escherichia coli]
RAPRRFDEKLQNELYMTQDEKERREHQPWVMARQLFNKVVRQHRHYGNATSARI